MDHHNDDHIQSSPAAAPQQQVEEEDQYTTSYARRLLLKVTSKRRTWVYLFILVYALLLHFMLAWYRSYPSGSARVSSSQALYASFMLGAVFGFIPMAAALAVALPSMLITWITILVLLTFCGKPMRVLGRKITVEIARFVGQGRESGCRLLRRFVVYHGDDDDTTFIPSRALFVGEEK